MKTIATQQSNNQTSAAASRDGWGWTNVAASRAGWGWTNTSPDETATAV